jgi:hypothetical protein
MSIQDKLLVSGVPDALLATAEISIARLDAHVDFFSDVWEILPWENRPGNRKKMPLRFDKFTNKGAKVIAKIYIAEKRVNRRICAATIYSIHRALLELDGQIGTKDFEKINTSDFDAIQLSYIRRGHQGKVPSLTLLQSFAIWLRNKLGLSISYDAPKLRVGIRHGRHGTEEGRAAKLMSLEVIARLFSLAQAPHVSMRDKFFLNAIVLAAATGMRIKELACLPVDCLVDQAGKWVVRLFPEKGGLITYRPFPQDMYPAVRSAVEYIKQNTADGRSIALNLKIQPGLDWQLIRRSEKALRYFAARFASEWMDKMSLFTPNGVYFRTSDQFVDAIGLTARLGSAAETAKYLGTSFRVVRKLIACQEGMKKNQYLYEQPFGVFHVLDSNVSNWKERIAFHPHVPTVKNMEAHYETALNDYDHIRMPVMEVLDEAVIRQIEGARPVFKEDPLFEKTYERKLQPVVRTANSVLLEPEDALFIIPRYFLSTHMRARSNQYTTVSSGMFSVWLFDCSKSGNSLFFENNVVDPKTGEIVKFTWHDLRHWLDTTYKQGGLSELQVNTILGRKDQKQGAVYDQTPALERSAVVHELIASIRGNKAVGVVQDTFNEISLANRQTAEAYLLAAVRIVNPMPHGGCLHNLALKPCPHSLSCFVEGPSGEPCDHLIIDSTDKAQYVELKWVRDNAETLQEYIKSAGGESSPQLTHFQNVAKSADGILNQILSKTKT